jgi:hypothetical protein
MAGKKHRARKVAPAPTPAALPTPRVVTSPPRRDLRPLIYFVLNEIFVAIYFYVLWSVIPNRHAGAAIHLWALPVLLQIMAIGTVLGAVKPEGTRRAGWWVAVVAGSGLLLVTVLLIVRVLVSAAFLSGVYGAFGKAAAMSALIGVALVIELVALLPLFQVKYLMTRSGRRTYAMYA